MDVAKMNAHKRRLDEILVTRGYLSDLRTARGWIIAGKVVVNGAVITKSGAQFRENSEIHLRGRPMRYASRGGYKLGYALDRFKIDVRGRVCLDVGASTGGFTDCLLQRGAARVYAIEVGFGQLRGRLAVDPRVTNRERTNISDVHRSDFDSPVEFAAADLSYLSMRKAVPIVSALFETKPFMVFLIKPLYEGLPQNDMMDQEALGRTLGALLNDLAKAGNPISDICVSPFLGGRGAVEFLAYFKGSTMLPPDVVCQRALHDFRSNPPRNFWEFLEYAT